MANWFMAAFQDAGGIFFQRAGMLRKAG